MQALKSLIAKRILECYPHAFSSPLEVEALFDQTPDLKLGDFTLACFKLAKTLRNAPPRIAQELKEQLEGQVEGLEKIESVNGYLNFFVRDSYKLGMILAMEAMGEEYGKNRDGEGKTMCIDYSSPNIAKPFHIGHLGTTVIGNSIKRLFAFSGYRCVGINHLGDWGTQFGKLIVAYKLWGDEAKIREDGVKELARIYKLYYDESQKDPSLDDRGREEFAKLEQGDEENLAIWQWFKDISLDGKFMNVYQLLGIEFESYAGESFYNDKMDAVVQELKDKKLLVESDGAMVVDLEKYSMPPCIVLKKDGSTIYATRDITAALYRKKTYDFDECIYVTDAGQSLHFRQVFKVLGLMGYDWEDRLVHVPYGKISINGQKLATRTGNVVLLEDLFADAVSRVRKIIEEKSPDRENKEEIAKSVGIGAVVFHQLSAGRIKDVNFVWEDALNFDGNTGPYAQYTFARACSVLEKAGKNAPVSRDYVLCDNEKALLDVLTRFPAKVRQARMDYEPSTITRYALDVCQAFNRFYHDCPILKADEAAKAVRVTLCRVTRNVLFNALWLIGLECPEKI